MRHYISILSVFILALFATDLMAQQSVFSAFSQSVSDADKAFIAKNYSKALSIYEDIAQKEGAPENIALRLARSYYFTYQYEKAVTYYERHEKTNLEFPTNDYFYFAEALSSIGNTKQALKYYQICMDKKPDDELFVQKIWRLNNLQYLYEDSIKNMAHHANMNTHYSELQMIPAGSKDVYLISNHPEVEMIHKIDTKENAPFYNLRKWSTYENPFSIVALNYENPRSAGNNLKTPFHLSAMCLFNKGEDMVYAASDKEKNKAGNYPLQLYFAKQKRGKWVKNKAFEHNDPNIDITEPAISQDGKTLVFSANFNEGFGGKDLYKSVKTEEGWSSPENLGSIVNTQMDERYPYIHNSYLYFASNGHPGLGGFDIYKAKMIDGKFQDLENLGYPINSTFDELSFNIDSLGQQGFMSSNRKNQGFDFDIYEFAMDLQIYPLEVEGIVKFIEHNWMDSTELKVLSNVQMELIDRTGNVLKAVAKTDNNGRFKLKVPYYSKYKIRIKGNDLDGFVSFEVPKFAKQDLSYEIVVVNDDFKNSLREENE
jgi:tetratricopeptide (TPR) repeat protein